MAISFIYPTLVTLDGVELTEESRTPIQESKDERSSSVETARGNIRKYIKKMARKWTVEWELMPLDDSLTIDGKGGRNELREIAYSESTHTFLFKDGKNGTETYTVWIEDYQEELVYRRGEFRYKISLTMTEQ